ncbi:stress-induced protein [Xanthomonas arboricola]|uniref:KGG domain-containing protein n=1 Tax=Xanthomonas arboricola TaxID=56448 RepID=UPI00061A4096|nr:KGG domain-containing protein [Xanthomonas arboricola]AKC81503.1 stress-induced protein [Xanthomonas arboricola]
MSDVDDAAKEVPKRGFATMSVEARLELASRGGRAAQASGNAHRFSSERAVEAGRKGGQAVSQDKEHMSRIGKKGGSAKHVRVALEDVFSPVPKSAPSGEE